MTSLSCAVSAPHSRRIVMSNPNPESTRRITRHSTSSAAGTSSALIWLAAAVFNSSHV